MVNQPVLAAQKQALYCLYATSDLQMQLKKLTLETETPAVTGDVNGDGVFDGQDAAVLQEFLLGESPVMENPSRADWNGDGTLDAFDLALMRQALCGNHEE